MPDTRQTIARTVENRGLGVRFGLLVPVYFSALIYPSFYTSELYNIAFISSIAPYLAIAAGFLILLLNARLVEFDRLFVAVMAICSLMFLSTVANDDNYFRCAARIISHLILLLVIRFLARNDPALLIRSAAWVFALFVIYNFVVTLVVLPKYPNGYYSDGSEDLWFLGHKNGLRNYMFPAVAFMLVKEKCLDERPPFVSIVLLICSVVNLYIVDSMTSLVILPLAVLWYLVGIRHTGLINARTMLIVFFAILVVTLTMTMGPIITSFLQEYLGRDPTLSGRTTIWGQAFSSIAEHPLFGVGLSHSETILYLVRSFGIWYASHTHNAVLSVAFIYGIPCLVVTLGVLLAICRALYVSRSEATCMVLVAALFAFLLCGVTGELSSDGFLTICFSAYYFAVFHISDFHKEKARLSER